MHTWVKRCSGVCIVLVLCVLAFGGCSDDTSHFVSEGSVAEPIDIGPAPATDSGTVAMGGDSFFVCAAEAGDWQVAISNITGKPDLAVYRDAAFSSFACGSENPEAEPDSCNVTYPAAGSIYIRVAGAQDAGASFNLSITAQVDVAAARR